MANISVNITEEMQNEMEQFIANTDPNAILLAASLHTSFASDLQNLLVSGPENAKLSKEGVAQIIACIRFQDKVLCKLFDISDEKIERESLNLYMNVNDKMNEIKKQQQEAKAHPVVEENKNPEDAVAPLVGVDLGDTTPPLTDVMDSAMQAINKAEEVIRDQEIGNPQLPFDVVEEDGMLVQGEPLEMPGA